MSDTYAEERIALQDVALKNAAGIDECDWDLIRSCFADDVEVVGMTPEPIHGGDNWLQFVKDALERYSSTQHMLGPQLATIDGDRAEQRIDVIATHFLKEPEGSRFTLWATYKSNFERRDGRWQIVRHELVRRGTSAD